MAIEQGIWKIGDKPEKLKPVGMADELLLEEQVMQDVAIINADWLLMAVRYAPTSTSSSICWRWTVTAT